MSKLDSVERKVFIARDEEFMRKDEGPSWIGFYDWLRTEEEKIVGLRLAIDDKNIDLAAFRHFLGVHVEIDKAMLWIRFSESFEFDEARSDDADFGGNQLFRGSRRSIALTFHAPRP